MKKQSILCLLILVSCIGANAQTNDADIHHRAASIASRMTDSLFLNKIQKDSIHSVTARLFAESQVIYKSNIPTDSLSFYMQKVEDKRDIMYKSILNDDQFLKYKKHKRSLLYGY
jgi:hypothetical protein